jgi:hypothetical protein
MIAQKSEETLLNNDIQEDLKKEKQIKYLKKQAMKYNFYPFFNLDFLAVNYIKSNCGDWVWPVMAEKLQRPEALFSRFAVHFTATMEMLGQEKCATAKDLYSFVTTSAEFEKARGVRTVFNRLSRKLIKEKAMSMKALSPQATETKQLKQKKEHKKSEPKKEPAKLKAKAQRPIEITVIGEPKKRRIAPIKPPPGWRGK